MICASATVPEATECTGSTDFGGETLDECGCDGLSCPDTERCRVGQLLCSCQPIAYNLCVESPCETAADCGGDICVPTTWLWGPRCVKPLCRSDADCNDHPGMRCVAVISYPGQRGNTTFAGTKCVDN